MLFSRGNLGSSKPYQGPVRVSILCLDWQFDPLDFPAFTGKPNHRNVQGIFANNRSGETRDLVCKTCASGTFSDILRDGPLALSCYNRFSTRNPAKERKNNEAPRCRFLFPRILFQIDSFVHRKGFMDHRSCEDQVFL